MTDTAVLESRTQDPDKRPTQAEFFRVHKAGRFYEVSVHSVSYVLARYKYLEVVDEFGDCHVVEGSLVKCEKWLTDHGFVRIHRNCLVRMANIIRVSIGDRLVSIDRPKTEIPCSKRELPQLIEKLVAAGRMVGG